MSMQILTKTDVISQNPKKIEPRARVSLTHTYLHKYVNNQKKNFNCGFITYLNNNFNKIKRMKSH